MNVVMEGYNLVPPIWRLACGSGSPTIGQCGSNSRGTSDGWCRGHLSPSWPGGYRRTSPPRWLGRSCDVSPPSSPNQSPRASPQADHVGVAGPVPRASARREGSSRTMRRPLLHRLNPRWNGLAHIRSLGAFPPAGRRRTRMGALRRWFLFTFRSGDWRQDRTRAWETGPVGAVAIICNLYRLERQIRGPRME